MYPFKEGHYAVENAWYVAAFSHEVTRTPFERWILDQPVALYRREDGTPVALDGRCPHHLYPLGKSALHGDNVRCGYHGLEFSPSGDCVASPFMDSIPPVCRVKSYRLAERWQWIWIWPGDPEQADESLIPDHFEIGLTNPAFRSLVGEVYDVKARYQLLNDNLLDLQHVEVLHSDNIGAAGVGRTHEERTEGDDWIRSMRTLRSVEPPATFKPIFGDIQVDRTFGLRFDVPGLHFGYDVNATTADHAEPGKELTRLNVFHAVTPARKHSCTYFTATSRSFGLDDVQLDDYMKASMPKTLDQDVFAAEQLERMWAAQGDRPREMLFRSDGTVVAGRRILGAMIERELKARAAAAAK